MPVAVTFAENASAEFWSKVVKTIGSIAAPAASAFIGPIGGAAVNTIANAISAKLDSKAKTQAKAAKSQENSVANKKANRKKK